MKKLSVSILLLSLFCVSGDVFGATTLTRNLYQGLTGDDVVLLQKVLNSSSDTAVATSGIGSKGFETNYFGAKTRDAVIRFQNKYANSILVPNGLTIGNGFVGASTRAMINTLSLAPVSQNTDQSVATIVAPIISSISPEVFNDGGILTLTGKGFTDHNNVIISGEEPDKYLDIKAMNNGTSISFPYTSSVGDKFRKEINFSFSKIPQSRHQMIIGKMLAGYRKDNGQPASNSQTMLVPVTLRVENENGTSTTSSFTINIFTNIQ